MARVYGVRQYRVNIPTANTPRALWTPTEGAASHQKFVEAFRITSLPANTGVMTVGGSNITINTGLITDGAPIDASGFVDFGVDPKVSALVSEFDLSTIFVTTTVAGDDYFITYISKES